MRSDVQGKRGQPKGDDARRLLSLALTSGRSFERARAAEVTAKVVAERLVAQLEQSGFVIIRKSQADTTRRYP